MDEQAPNSDVVEMPIREWLEDRRHIGMKLGLEATMTMLARLDMPHMHFLVCTLLVRTEKEPLLLILLMP